MLARIYSVILAWDDPLDENKTAAPGNFDGTTETAVEKETDFRQHVGESETPDSTITKGGVE